VKLTRQGQLAQEYNLPTTRSPDTGTRYLSWLSSFGQAGVERVLELLRAELTLTMRQCGTPTIAQITRASVLRNGIRL
jgi:isopentenyl diphosphate isomerase/L-lactate dehydrogenase-like FMN-dependent dehydrogenase